MKKLLLVASTLFYVTNVLSSDFEFSCKGLSENNSVISLNRYFGEKFNADYVFSIKGVKAQYQTDYILRETSSSFDNVTFSSEGLEINRVFNGGGSASYRLLINLETSTAYLKSFVKTLYQSYTNEYKLDCVFAMSK